MAAHFAKATSELARHSEPGGTRDEEEDSWILALENESVDSFLTNCPPSFMEKSWISAQHDGRTKLVEEYYTTQMGAAEGAYGRDNMEEIKAAWEESETKNLETLTAVLKEHKYGSGKWMIFVTAADVDATWRKVVTALWDGKLGHTAKVSGNTPECNGSHVINVFVDPFWETSEVERVLAALRELCGVSDAIKYKADGVTQLGLYKGNEHGIPPSFYAANRNSLTLSVQKSSMGGADKGEKSLESARSARGDGGNDKWSRNTMGNTWGARREAPRPARSAPVAPQPKKSDAKKVSAFAALAGADDDDAEAILAKKAAKKEKARRKKAEQEEAAVAKSEDAFEALKGKLKADWGDEEDEEEEEFAAAPEDDEEVSSSEEDESEEEEEEEAAPAPPPPTAAAPDISDAPAKEKTAEELEVEALMAALDSKDGDEDKAGAGGMSKAAAKRAKKKAAAAAGEGGAEDKAGGAAADAAAGDGAEPENTPENEGPKNPADIKKLMAAKAAAKKKKDAGASSSGAAAALLAEAKARAAMDGGKKKKGPKTWEGGGKQVGQKARGSDNKYQGE